MAGKKKPLVITAIVVVIILLILIITPFFIDADRFRPQIESALSEKLGRKVQIGHLSVSLFSGSLQADQISIADDPAYSQGAFLTAKSLAVGIDVMPLIFSRDLRVHALEFKEPQIQLLRTPAGVWNFSTLGATAGVKPAAASEPTPNATSSGALNSFTVDKLKISDGTIAFGRMGQPTRLAYQDVNVSAKNISQTVAFPFTFDAKTPGGGKLDLAGNVGPIGSGGAGKMPFDGQLKVIGVPSQDLENLLAVLGYALPQGSSLKGGTIKANLVLHGPLDRMVTQGPVELSDVTLAGFSLASKLAGALGQTGTATGNDTLIKLASSNLRYAPDGLRADSVNIVIPMIGGVTGAGTVSPSNTLNFRLLAKLDGSSSLAQLTKLPFFSQGGGLPFRIEGSASSPRVIPDIAGFDGLKGLTKTPLNQLKVPDQGQLGGIIGGLLKKKKPQPQ
ncbi:MAG TPA: AsmA family protein [Candidatus Acidoferrales bacterium]|nr:AsmA family protein [Candidatus Acidoferrales bacterium]